MNIHGKHYVTMMLRVIPSQNEKLEILKKQINDEYKFKISKNDFVRIAIAEFLKYNHDVVKLKKTLKKYTYI